MEDQFCFLKELNCSFTYIFSLMGSDKICGSKAGGLPPMLGKAVLNEILAFSQSSPVFWRIIPKYRILNKKTKESYKSLHIIEYTTLQRPSF